MTYVLNMLYEMAATYIFNWSNLKPTTILTTTLSITNHPSSLQWIHVRMVIDEREYRSPTTPYSLRIQWHVLNTRTKTVNNEMHLMKYFSFKWHIQNCYFCSSLRWPSAHFAKNWKIFCGGSDMVKIYRHSTCKEHIWASSGICNYTWCRACKMGVEKRQKIKSLLHKSFKGID